MTIELWSKTKEAQVMAETKVAGDGAPYQVAHLGKTITVTRRCARAMFKAGMITGSRSRRGGTEGGKEIKADLRKQQLAIGGNLSFNVKPSGKDGVFIVSCPEMNFEAPTKDPAREMMLLATEWWELIDHGTGSFEAECAGDWRLQN